MTEEAVFSYQLIKDSRVIISWHGKEVTILGGNDASKFIKRIKNADPGQTQLIMAKATGNFKRGNERQPKRKG